MNTTGNVLPPAQAPAVASDGPCECCDSTGDIHDMAGEWRGECPFCPVAITREFQSFHRMLCERFGYTHDPIDWRRDQVSLMEHIAALPAVAREVDEAVDMIPMEWLEEVLAKTPNEIYIRNDYRNKTALATCCQIRAELRKRQI